jgi:hypothetical protein
MRSAKLYPGQYDLPADDLGPDDAPQSHTDASALKQQVAERLAAHRSRRNRQSGPTLLPLPTPTPAPTPARKSSIAAAVAERYAQTQSYREFLAAEAERAIQQAHLAAQQAHATAEVAARSAQAVAAAQQQLLEELEAWNQPPIEEVSRAVFDQLDPRTAQLDSRTTEPRAAIRTEAQAEEPRVAAFPAPEPSVAPEPFLASRPAINLTPAEFTVRLYEDIGVHQTQSGALHHNHMANPLPNPADPDESYALDEEIEFRQAPIFEEFSGPPVPIPANLIEFPRQLVAPRKARPRIAEGPLLDEAEAAAASVQLRIFEVEPTQISHEHLPEPEATAPVWSSILLDAPPVAQVFPEPHAEPVLLTPLEVAPLDLRLMAGLVDLSAVGLTFLSAVTAFALWTSALPSGLIAAITAAAAFTTLFVLYQMLFFTFDVATPGMRYARISLCTFDDENPTRSQMRHRTWAILISALPLGLGLLWAWFDGEGLGWHDRLTRMYQRHY